MSTRTCPAVLISALAIAIANAQFSDLLPLPTPQRVPTQVDVDRAQIAIANMEAARRAEEIEARRAAEWP